MSQTLWLILIIAFVAVILTETTSKTSGTNVYTGNAHEPILVIGGGVFVLFFIWVLITSLGR